MTRTWFSQELETVATYWRVLRRDGVALGFTTHDADLWFDGVLHRSAPGMVPSAIRRSSDLEPDSAEIEGALTHDAISAADLAIGRYDGAWVSVGLVDWENLQRWSVFSGALGQVSHQSGKFSATLESRKAELRVDAIPRTSPTCRARFCGPQCSLSAAHFTLRADVVAGDADRNTVKITSLAAMERFAGGELRWRSGPAAGLRSG